ncbi:UNVERIFIED_CONTAM: hypothetical protein FKN15_011157 [Acipenser sinensis]
MLLIVAVLNVGSFSLVRLDRRTIVGLQEMHGRKELMKDIWNGVRKFWIKRPSRM